MNAAVLLVIVLFGLLGVIYLFIRGGNPDYSEINKIKFDVLSAEVLDMKKRLDELEKNKEVKRIE